MAAEGFRLEYVDGQQYRQPAAAIGWARAQRLPAVRSSMAQLEFMYEAFNIRAHYVQKQFSPAQVTLTLTLALALTLTPTPTPTPTLTLSLSLSLTPTQP